MIFVSPTINHLNLSILCEHNVHCLQVSRVQTRETCPTARQKRVTHKTQLLASGSIDFRLSHRFTVANPSYTRETILLRPRFLERPRHRRLSDIFPSSTWQNYPIYLVWSHLENVSRIERFAAVNEDSFRVIKCSKSSWSRGSPWRNVNERGRRLAAPRLKGVTYGARAEGFA